MSIKTQIKISGFLLCCLLGFSCTNTRNNELREGDLLFQNLDCGGLCDAIEAVTDGVNGKDFSHCAMVVEINDTLKVIEAIGSEVQVNSLKDFYARSGDTATFQNITFARVKKEFEGLIPKAAAFAKQQIGQPYDDAFLLNNGKWYCSELLYQAFKEANNGNDFFTLQPMTYKDPATNAFFPAWVDYYKALNQPIPEGQPGTNPGLISRSDKIQILDANKIEHH